MDRVCSTDRLCPGFGKAKMLRLPLLDQLLPRPSHIFDWHVCINAMLIKQIDGIDFETLERRVRHLLNMLRPAIQAWRSLHPSGIKFRVKVEPEFRCDHHLSTKRRQSFAYKSSFVNGPYTSAVSKNVTPRSTAVRMREIISDLSAGGPYEKLIPIQPSPRAETSSWLLPSVRFSIFPPKTV